jgi:predicted sulfurtransferase
MIIGRGINTVNRAIIHNSGTVLAFQREVSYVRRRRIAFPFNGWPLASSPTSHKEEEENKILTNQELVERRLEVNRSKRQVRERNVQERVSRHLHIKRLLHSESNDTNVTSSSKSKTTPFEVPPLYAVKVFVDEKLREELKLSGREKRGRVFIEAGSEGTKTFRGLKDEMFGFFRALRKNSFLLTANLPQVDENGTVIAVVPLTTTDEDVFYNLHWKIENDEDVVKTFALANEYFLQNSTSSTLSTMKRPSVQINVGKDPNAPLPLPPPAYLNGMPDPVDSPSMTMLSFYAFPPATILDVEEFAFNLRKIWKPFQALGRVYVAHEGVNAQMSVPTNVLSHFMECCRSIPELGRYMENDINIDPKPLSQEEFAVAGVPHNGQPAPPFRNLHVRVRNQVVADGLDTSLDWQSAGYDMPPLEWHERLMQAREQTTEQKEKVDGDDEAINKEGKYAPIILDCRNNYETDVGIFEGAEALGTESFRDSWDVLKERLADTPKDAPIMAYCTGGIRCEFIYYRNCVLVFYSSKCIRYRNNIRES